MDFNQAVAVLSKRLSKKQPRTFTSLWLRINAPATYRFIKKNIKNAVGDTDWDAVISSLDRRFQCRWMGENGKRRKKPVKEYANKAEVELVLRPYQKKLYAFISPADRSDYVLCDKISIALVRLVQKGNIFAREKFAELVQYIINDWTERNQRLCRWKGYISDIQIHLERCIRRFRYAGTFLGYLFRTLECAGRGLRPLYAYSLDENFPESERRRVDNVIKDYETGDVRYLKNRR